MTKKHTGNDPFSSVFEKNNRAKLKSLFQQSNLNSHLGDALIDNLPLFMNRQEIMRMIFFKELYEKILNTHGVVMEFGCRWGKNLSLLTAYRGIYEPYNHNRKIIGFDTFEGLKGITSTDGDSPFIQEGGYDTTRAHEKYLEEILTCLENECPIPNIKKFEIVKGDVRETLPKYLECNPQTVIAFAYFDMDIYEPTKCALEAILPHVTKGTIIGFDEMNWETMPGPTLALKEVLGLDRYKVCRSPLQPIPGWIEIC